MRPVDLADLLCRCYDTAATDEELVDEDLIFVLTHQLVLVRGDAELVRAWVTESVDREVRARALVLLDELIR